MIKTFFLRLKWCPLLCMILLCFSISIPLSAGPESKVEPKPKGFPKGSEVRVMTDRTSNHLQPLWAMFQEDTGITVKSVYLKKGLVNRFRARPREADVVLVKNIFLLEQFKQEGLLGLDAKLWKNSPVDKKYWDTAGKYTSLSSRGRVIYFNRKKVKPSQLDSYFDLAKPEWKGRICIRSGYHNYNLSLFSQLAVVYGPKQTEKFLRGLAANLARAPKGNDRAQIKAIMQGKCDLAIANHYYYGVMLGIPEQKPWAEATRMFFPEQKASGTVLLRSGVALTQNQKRRAEAKALISWLQGPRAQGWISGKLYSFPVLKGVAISGVNQDFTVNVAFNKQSYKRRKLASKKVASIEKKSGKAMFKTHVVPLSSVLEKREWVMKVLNDVNFDRN